MMVFVDNSTERSSISMRTSRYSTYITSVTNAVKQLQRSIGLVSRMIVILTRAICKLLVRRRKHQIIGLMIDGKPYLVNLRTISILLVGRDLERNGNEVYVLLLDFVVRKILKSGIVVVAYSTTTIYRVQPEINVGDDR